jgi:hypothetical protein
LAVWEAGHEGLKCALYYSWSADGGNAWQPPQAIETLPGCPEQSQLLPAGDNFTLLLTTVLGTTYVVAWDGNKWSRADVQDSLTVFLYPVTYKEVHFSCHQAVLAGDDLYVIGCDAGGGHDIWLLSRHLGTVGDWFSPPTAWETPQAVTTGEARIESPVLVADNGGRLHVFWDRLNGPAIYHAVWDGVRWSQPRVIFTAPTTKAGELAATLDKAGHLLVAWGDAEAGQIQLIKAEADRAILASNWSSPLALMQLQSLAAWPDINVGENGRVYLTFSVPVNEGRGIYMTWSDDHGESWAEPVTAFDGVAAGWAMVGRPRLTLTTNGHLYLLWTRHTMPGGPGPLALFYASSNDGGRSWSEPRQIAEGAVTWADIASVGERVVHLVWQIKQDSSVVLRHLVSQDGGLSWSLPATVIGLDGAAGPPSMTVDENGQLHLLHGTIPALQHWLWNGGRWSRAEDLSLKDSLAINELTAAIVPGAGLGLVYSGQILDETTQQLQNSLSFSIRPLGSQSNAAVPTLPPVTTLVPTPTLTPTVARPPSSSPVPTLAVIAEVAPASGQQNALASGILPAGLIVLVGFAVGLLVVRSRH